MGKPRTFKAKDKNGIDTTFAFEEYLEGEVTIVRDGQKIVVEADHILQFVLECWLKGPITEVKEIRAEIEALKAQLKTSKDTP